jgi:hypothetical protein
MLGHPSASHRPQEPAMTLCPIAVVAGCAKCPAYKVCPLKTVIGDASKAPPSQPPQSRKK